MPNTLAAILFLIGVMAGCFGAFMMHDVDARKIVLIIAVVFILLALVAEISASLWR